MADTSFDDVRDGDAIEPRLWNVIYRELRRWRKAKATPPMKITSADGLMPPVFSLGPINTGCVGKITGSDVTAGSYGTGVFTMQIDTGTGWSDSADMTSIPCVNLLNKKVKVGSKVACLWIGTTWLIVAVDDCTNLT